MYIIVSTVGCIVRCVLPGIEISDNMPWQFNLFVLCGGIEAVLHILSFISVGTIITFGNSIERSGCYTLMYVLYYLTTIPLFFYNTLHVWAIIITVVLIALLFCFIIFISNHRD